MNPVILRRFIKRAHPRLKAEARNFGSKLETQSSKLEDQKSSLGSARSKLEIAKLEELEARKYLARCNPTGYLQMKTGTALILVTYDMRLFFIRFAFYSLEFPRMVSAIASSNIPSIPRNQNYVLIFKRDLSRSRF